MKAIPAYPEIRVTNSTHYSTKESRKKLSWNVLFTLSNPQILYNPRVIESNMVELLFLDILGDQALLALPLSLHLLLWLSNWLGSTSKTDRNRMFQGWVMLNVHCFVPFDVENHVRDFLLSPFLNERSLCQCTCPTLTNVVLMFLKT